MFKIYLSANAERGAPGIVEKAAHHFFGIAVAQLLKTQGPDVVAISHIAQFDKNFDIGWIVAQYAQALTTDASAGAESRQ